MKSKIIITVAAFSFLLSVVIVLMPILINISQRNELAFANLITETANFTNEADYNEFMQTNGIVDAKKSDKKFVSAAIRKVGEETQSEQIYFLYLELRVEYDPSASVFQIEARAHWDNKTSYAGIMTAEGTSEDFLAITWGGAGGLCATDKNMYGKYYGSDKTEIFSRRISDSYNGFVWQFEERNGVYGDILEEGSASITLKPVKSNITAGVRLTYIHTAHKTDYGMMTMNYGQREAYAPSIFYETIGNSFKTELCIEDLVF